MSAVLSHEQIQNFQNFLHSVTNGCPDETEALLIATPEITQDLLRISGTLTDNSGRTFNCTAYEYAHWAKDVKMCRMLERHMDDETCSPIYACITVNDVKGLVYRQNDKEYHIHSKGFDFNPLIAVLDNLDKKKSYIEESRKEYETSLNMLEQKQSNVDKAKNDVEQARSHAIEVQRNAATAKQELEKARDDAKKTQGDVEEAERNAGNAQDNAELALRNMDKAQDNEELALRNAEQAQRDVEQARLNVEQAPRNAEQAQHDVEQAWRDVPAYIPRDYCQQELRNIDKKNTIQLKELRDTLNRKKRLLIDSILQAIPEYSLLYDPINNLKQKTMSLPSDIRDSISIELGFLMKNINNPGMDNSDFISRFEENCCSKVGDYYLEKIRNISQMTGTSVFPIMTFITMTISVVGIFATTAAAMWVGAAYLGVFGFLLGALAGFIVGIFAWGLIAGAISIAAAVVCGGIAAGVYAIYSFFKVSSIKNAVHNITESVSNPVIQLSGHEESLDLTTPDTSLTQDRDLAEEYRSAAPLGLFSGNYKSFSKGDDGAVTYSPDTENEYSDNGLTQFP